MKLHAVLAVALCFPGARAAAQGHDARFANPAPGRLTVKLVIEGHFDRPGKFPGEKFEGTVHREVSGSTYLDVVSVGPGASMPVGAEGKVYAAGSETPAPPNEVQDMAKAVEKCNGNQQCIMAIATKSVGGPAGSTPAFMTGYANWTTFGREGRGCFDGTARIRESYKKVSLNVHEGGGGLGTLTWTVTGEGQVPAPDSFNDMCGSQVLLDTRRGTYDLSLELNPELEVRSTSPGASGPRTEELLPIGPMDLVVRGQKVPAEGMTLSGSARFLHLFTMEDGSKVDAVMTWTFTPGRGR